MLLSLSSKLQLVIVVIHMIMIGAASDHLALLEIKSKITLDPQGALTSWNDSLPFCRWRGVTCGRRHPRITILNLKDKGLVGSLSPYLGNMSFLHNITLENNQLHGSLGENDLVGVFPSFLLNLSMIRLLNLPDNQLQGSLPSNFCLSQPHFLGIELGGNHLNRFLPPAISNCSELEVDVNKNDLKGGIAIDFGRLQHLRTLYLGGNNFGSKDLDDMSLFHSLSNDSSLMYIDLSNNRLRGVLPNSHGNLSSKLSSLAMHSNYISGSIPSSIGNLLGPTSISVGQNNFTCIIPESIGKLQNLQELYLDTNHLSGIIPRSLGNLSLVTIVAFGGNNFEGTIPSTIGSCKNLIVLDLDENKLSGSVPKELFQLSSLSMGLDLSLNNLSGVLPQEIGNMKLLESLDFSMNRFTGELPSSLSSCISLQSLKLSGNFFYGSMPGSYSSLKGLEYVDLSRNNFSGHIPTYLQQILLSHLNLSYNNFEGDVPVKGIFANTSAISVLGNTRLCGGAPWLHQPKCTSTTSDSRRRTRKLSVRVVVAISLSSTIAGIGLLSFVLFYCCIKKKRDKPSESILGESFEKISYGRLFKATEGFSSENLIGTGSFASVYKGVLDENGFTVAIKVLNLQHRGGFKSFMAECEALRHIRHRNLVKVITSCSSIDYQSNDFKALVYDFMPNGSLDRWLYSTHHKPNLVQRMGIIEDVACALDYLHCHCGNVVVHCDLKPSNILLDADMVAHVGDFGLAKILSLEKGSNANESSSSIIRGTIGYAPPEYGLGNEVSTSGDIYSFGILLLEMLTGKKPVDPMFEGGLGLHSYARSALADGFGLQIVDPMLLNDYVDETSLISLVKIGVHCSYESPQDRMDIGTVVHELFGNTVLN
ncbi:hypothetical protein L1987_35306 [Smallanthus sonchifolius]|uniref:Uncharacterized protein n=1 Tax=Smallanthus sonchifolius TaxID=185202 RepID=A0ACB9HXZ7_9ASTR|nr:hypothetical protein L1987_35306 [Smallanthus sonchifolius]